MRIAGSGRYDRNRPQMVGQGGAVSERGSQSVTTIVEDDSNEVN